jgi:hypothetical protein
MLPSACSFIAEVSCHCFTLHVSAYMAIFRCVGCYYSHVLEGICFAGFFYILHLVTLCTWFRFCTFPSVEWVKYEVLFIIINAIFTVMVYMFFITCVFLFYFSHFILLFLAWVFICLSFRVVCLFGAAICCLFLTSTIKLHADGNITCKKPLNNTVQQDAKI